MQAETCRFFPSTCTLSKQNHDRSGPYLSPGTILVGGLKRPFSAENYLPGGPSGGSDLGERMLSHPSEVEKSHDSPARGPAVKAGFSGALVHSGPHEWKKIGQPGYRESLSVGIALKSVPSFLFLKR